MVGLRSRDNWETPQHVVDAVAAFMGSPPTIDLCASPHNKKAPHFIGATPELGGPLESIAVYDVYMRVGAFGWCWINPPYSRSAILSIARWLAEAARSGLTIALLVNIDKSTRWYRELAPHIRAELVPSTRIQFIPPAGIEASRNSKTQSVLILGKRQPWDLPAGVYPSFPLEIGETSEES